MEYILFYHRLYFEVLLGQIGLINLDKYTFYLVFFSKIECFHSNSSVKQSLWEVSENGLCLYLDIQIIITGVSNLIFDCARVIEKYVYHHFKVEIRFDMLITNNVNAICIFPPKY